MDAFLNHLNPRSCDLAYLRLYQHSYPQGKTLTFKPGKIIIKHNRVKNWIDSRLTLFKFLYGMSIPGGGLVRVREQIKALTITRIHTLYNCAQASNNKFLFFILILFMDVGGYHMLKDNLANSFFKLWL